MDEKVVLAIAQNKAAEAGSVTQEKVTEAVSDYITDNPSALNQSAVEAIVGDRIDDIVLVQNTQPTEEDNKIWIPNGEIAETQVPTYEEFSQLKNSLDTATDSDIGKALSPKTVTGGHVTEWQFKSIGGGGAGGTLDYSELENKPQINGVTLTGNKSLADLGVASASDVAGKYTKPVSGIPASDLSSAVQASLGKADTALQGQDVTSAVDNYLETNFSNPSNPPLDRTLTSSLSAAPADMVGEIKSAVDDNLLNNIIQHVPENWWHDYNTGYISADGTVVDDDTGYVYGDFIPVKAGDTLYAKYGSALSDMYMRHIAVYDSNKTIIPSAGTNSNKKTYQLPDNNSIAFVVVSLTYNNRKACISINSIPETYSEYFTPYDEYLKDFITDETKETIKNNGKDVALINEYITNTANPIKTSDFGKLSDFGIGLPVLSRGYLSFSNGSVVVNDADSSLHMYTDFIPVTPGDAIAAKTLMIKRNGVEYSFVDIPFRSVIAYDENANPIESASAVPASSVANYIVPDGVTFLKLSLYKMYEKNDKAIARIYITSEENEKQQPRIIPNYCNTQTIRVASLTNKTAILKPNNVIHNSTWAMCGKIGSGFTSVRIGNASYNSSTVKWEASYPYIEVYQDNGTWKIDICGYDEPTLAANYNKTYPLGFVPSENICVAMEIGRTLKIEKLRVLSGMNQWSLENESDYNNVIFNEMWNALCVTVTGTLEDVSLSQSIEQIHSKVWVFGDSWLSVYDHRVGGQLNALGADGWLKSSIHGLNSAKAITAVRTLVEMATPQTIVWAIGMNDSDLDASTVNADWKSAAEELMNICDKNGIELILYTVPSVPATQGTTTDSPRPMWAKNAYIRASGYRYIDAEKAVGANNANGYWYDGYWKSDTDHTHTSVEGALAVAMQYCADCPEIMYLH